MAIVRIKDEMIEWLLKTVTSVASIYLDRDDFKSADPYCMEALDIAKDICSKHGEFSLLRINDGRSDEPASLISPEEATLFLPLCLPLKTLGYLRLKQRRNGEAYEYYLKVLFLFCFFLSSSI